MPTVLTFDAPLQPSEYFGRAEIVRHICERLLNPERLSTSVVGGPKTGKTSLLRWLASPSANHLLPDVPYRVYLDAQILPSTASPQDFWVSTMRSLQGRIDAGPLAVLLDAKLTAAKSRPLNNYDVEDIFDAFGKQGKPVVLLVDNFERLLQNENFWGDFFHAVRALGQRHERGLAFVLSTPRELLDLWQDQFGSVYYNIFTSVRLGRLEESDVRDAVRRAFTGAAAGQAAALENEAIRIVLAASEGHPYLVTFVIALLTEQLQSGAIDVAALRARLGQPGGPVVTLIHMIRAALSPSERVWVDQIAQGKGITGTQRSLLQQLREIGLLPPGTRL